MNTNPEEFVSYLKGTLIPDLRESGSNATADDFQSAVDIIEQQERLLKAFASQVVVVSGPGKTPHPLLRRTKEGGDCDE